MSGPPTVGPRGSEKHEFPPWIDDQYMLNL